MLCVSATALCWIVTWRDPLQARRIPSRGPIRGTRATATALGSVAMATVVAASLWREVRAVALPTGTSCHRATLGCLGRGRHTFESRFVESWGCGRSGTLRRLSVCRPAKMATETPDAIFDRIMAARGLRSTAGGVAAPQQVSLEEKPSNPWQDISGFEYVRASHWLQGTVVRASPRGVWVDIVDGGTRMASDLTEVLITPLEAVRSCTYLDTERTSNTWTLTPDGQMSWLCSDGGYAPPIKSITFRAIGEEGEKNIVETDEWYSQLPSDNLERILAELRSMADAAGIQHNIQNRMQVWASGAKASAAKARGLCCAEAVDVPSNELVSVFKQGRQVHVRVTSVDLEKGELGLSMKGGAEDIKADVEAQLATLRAAAAALGA